MSWFGFLFDTTIVGWLLWRRTRFAAYAVVLVFHILTRLLFDIGMFPIIMCLSALVFFPPDWPRQLGAWFGRRRSGGRSPAPASPLGVVPTNRPNLATRLAIGLGAFYCAAQVVMPLRGHAYGGNVLWHEQGMRFSWRVMIRAKGGATTFLVKDKATGHVVHVSPREYLTPFQENEMAGQPDLILQLARHIKDDFKARDLGDVEVRTDSIVSLNGRRGVPLVDPEIDLAATRDGLGRAAWILPAPTTAPPPTRPVR
jgi:vitamin K-dependent gamma-carboxylase